MMANNPNFTGPPRDAPEHHEPRVPVTERASGWGKRQMDKFGRTDVDLGWFDLAAGTLLMFMAGASVAGLLAVLIKLPVQIAVRLSVANLAIARTLFGFLKVLNCCTTPGVIVGGVTAVAFKRRVMQLRWGQQRLGLIGLVAVSLIVFYAAGFVLSESLGQVGQLVLEGSPTENKIRYCQMLEERGLTQPDWCYTGPVHCQLLEKVGAPLPAHCKEPETTRSSVAAGQIEAFAVALFPLIRGMTWVVLGLLAFLLWRGLIKRRGD